MKTRLIIVLISLLTIQCKHNPSSRGGVIATNAWTAAYALAAGIDSITILAPYEMVHPSEYEMRPGDIARIESAELIIHAGYEVMIDQIKAGLDLPEEKLLAINTSYNYEEIVESVLQIAENRQNEEIARKNLEEIRQVLDYGKEAIRKNGLDTIPVLVHFFQESFASETGLKAAGIFGPAPPEPRKILSLTLTRAKLIIDNAHNPAGGALRETIENVRYAELINFPGLYGTRTLEDVIRYNVEQLTALDIP
jgi:zinc transport system substrate-binding protein